LRHHRLRALITTYDRRTAQEKMPILLHRLRAGSRVALVSDCGTPGLYDPGALLVAHAHRAGIPVVAVPGPSALAAALSIAGMPGDALCFHGRFPVTVAAGVRLLAPLRARHYTSIFFLAPERLRQALTLIERCLGNRTVLVAVNLTRPTESIVRGKVRGLLASHHLRYPGADLTLVVDGR
jgi:16S rRNA (cytidine1402-2'-O)-methyltransferase